VAGDRIVSGGGCSTTQGQDNRLARS
jgi:hypothetical protein